jgi:hypothetical protein
VCCNFDPMRISSKMLQQKPIRVLCGRHSAKCKVNGLALAAWSCMAPALSLFCQRLLDTGKSSMSVVLLWLQSHHYQCRSTEAEDWHLPFKMDIGDPTNDICPAISYVCWSVILFTFWNVSWELQTVWYEAKPAIDYWLLITIAIISKTKQWLDYYSDRPCAQVLSCCSSPTKSSMVEIITTVCSSIH